MNLPDAEIWRQFAMAALHQSGNPIESADALLKAYLDRFSKPLYPIQDYPKEDKPPLPSDGTAKARAIRHSLRQAMEGFSISEHLDKNPGYLG